MDLQPAFSSACCCCCWGCLLSGLGGRCVVIPWEGFLLPGAAAQGRAQHAALALGAELLLGAEDGVAEMPPPRGKAAKEALRKVLPPPAFLCACKTLVAPSLLLHKWECRWGWGADPGSVSVAPMLGWEGMHAAVWINDDQQMQSQRACPCTDLSCWDLWGKRKGFLFFLLSFTSLGF